MNKKGNVITGIFIEGLGGMTQGLFATLVIGTIIQQMSLLIDGNVGNYLYIIGRIVASLTGAGIGVGVAHRLGAQTLVMVSAATVGMIGAFASRILAGDFVQDGVVVLSGAGETLGAFVAVYVAVTIGEIIAGKTKLDLLLTPIITIGVGTVVGLLVGPPISRFMNSVGSLVNWATEQQPLFMGMFVAIIMGMLLTSPISSMAISVILNLSGLAAGAATIGCCCNMVGFAVASYRENKMSGLLAQGIGTSMLQMPNIIRKPIIWLPVILSSAILGPIGTLFAHMRNNATGAGMGSSGLVGPLMTWRVMTETEPAFQVLVKISLFHLIFPALLTLFITELMRRKGWIKLGDMGLSL
jgi:Predicted membrane protein, putative toxin regulator